ncbi:RNA chaperone Hfq [Caballeronia sp. S22]|uniref:RNA chaperone Hfq n=1 Tax=Caballeronia sp. S22 TaxID=3137182 RepID=UPI0035309DF5
MSRIEDDVQTSFLNDLLGDREIVWIFLVNGIKLTGYLEAFDQYVVSLQSPTGTQAVFKSAISTVCRPHTTPNKTTDERSSTVRIERPARRHVAISR